MGFQILSYIYVQIACVAGVYQDLFFYFNLFIFMCKQW